MITSIDSILRRLRGSHIALLIALDDHGSLRKAAQQVSLSQPATTKSLHEIERIFGAELFVRSRRGVLANEFGQCVIRHARALRQGLGALRDELVALERGGGGTLAIGAVMEAVPLWLVPVLGAMRETQPEVSVEVWEDNSVRLLSMLDQRTLDLVLGRVNMSPHPDAYDFTPLDTQEMCFIVDAASPLARRRGITFRDIAQELWILPSAHVSTRLLLERIFEEQGEPFPSHGIETSSTYTTLTLLRTSRGAVSLVPRAVAEPYAQCGLIGVLPIEAPRPGSPYGIATRRGAALSWPAQMFIELALARAQRPAPRVSGRLDAPGPMHGAAAAAL